MTVRTITLRDAIGKVLGYQERRGDKIILYNIVHRELGYYDVRKNETWQTYPMKKLISREGDILATLLEK